MPSYLEPGNSRSRALTPANSWNTTQYYRLVDSDHSSTRDASSVDTSPLFVLACVLASLRTHWPLNASQLLLLSLLAHAVLFPYALSGFQR